MTDEVNENRETELERNLAVKFATWYYRSP